MRIFREKFLFRAAIDSRGKFSVLHSKKKCSPREKHQRSERRERSLTILKFSPRLGVSGSRRRHRQLARVFRFATAAWLLVCGFARSMFESSLAARRHFKCEHNDDRLRRWCVPFGEEKHSANIFDRFALCSSGLWCSARSDTKIRFMLMLCEPQEPSECLFILAD
jgi:hypothetical protein